MKRIVSVIVAAVLCLSFASCTKTEKQKPTNEPVAVSDETESALTSGAADSNSSTADGEAAHDSEETYTDAVKTAYQKIQAGIEEDATDETLSAYFTDLNGDGYKDIVYQSGWFPHVMLYDNGEFVDCEISEEVLGGSLFPSGKESGYFIDPKQGIIVIRYDGHTFGTATYRGAQAFKIAGKEAECLWTEYFDADAEDEKYRVESEDDWDRVTDLVNKEFDEKQYFPRIKEYELVNYYDVCTPWDGSVN